MKYSLYLLAFLIVIAGPARSQQTPFERSGGNKSATYFEAIAYYTALARVSPKIKLLAKGLTDAGYPLHVVLISNDGRFNPSAWHDQHKVVILINNGIHPGEPDGIDASMMLARDILLKKSILPDNVVLAIIPVYNIGGALNRNSFSRANQNGPEAYGFRGNAENLDLNRDFIKCDSRDARAFTEVFHFCNPDILIDNHVSDGADYQHVMTLISTQYDKLGPDLGPWLKESFEPQLYREMHDRGWDLVPYVNVEDSDPARGFTQFYDPPRYSSGYAALFNTISFMPETHMLKPYRLRVRSTYDLMVAIIGQAGRQAGALLSVRKKACRHALEQRQFALDWQPDTTQSAPIVFKGYAAGYRTSQVTHFPILFYDHLQPYSKVIPYHNVFKPQNIVNKPVAYVIPQGWWAVIELLKANQVAMTQLKKDSVIQVMAYHIENYQSLPQPYEKHHKNYNVRVSATRESLRFLRGDFVIRLNEAANRYLIETLEPTGKDGFFAWNFFDAVLQQKEGYSDYRWDSTAAHLLTSDDSLRERFMAKKVADSSFAASADSQLRYIYENSPWFEPAYLRYPVYRIDEGQ